VLKEHSKAFAVIFQRANQQLKTIFGAELVELPVREKKTGMSSAARRGWIFYFFYSFILVS